MRAPRSFALLPLLLSACGGALAVPRPPARSEASPPILAEVLTYAVRQFGATAGPAEICVAVRGDDGLRDPSASVLRRLSDQPGVKPQSACSSAASAIVLVVGPIEWLADDDVRVAGSYTRRALRVSSALKYRVVWESGRWVCLGPVLSGDPL